MLTPACTIALLMLGSAQQKPSPVQISAVSAAQQSVPVYGRIQFDIRLSGTITNPFDPDEVSLDAEIEAPSGRRLSVPGFFAGEAWHVRFSPLEAGEHRVRLKAKTQTEGSEWPELAFVATEAQSGGFIRVSEKDPRYLVDSRGEPFFAIGMNYPRVATLEGYEVQLKRFAAAGGNTARLFLNPPEGPFALHKKEVPAHLIDLEGAARLERALEISAANGVRTMLVFETPETLGPRWAASPYGLDNKGPLRYPQAYWTDASMERLVRNRLRYVVARYGADANLMAWSLWHEPDTMLGYKEDEVLRWHERVASALQGMDPYGRLIGTALQSPLGVKDLDRLPALGFVQSHITEVSDFAPQVSLMQARKVSYGKPHLVTMVASDRKKDVRALDPKGLQYHDSIWASITSGTAGTAMPWWNEIFRDNDLFWVFKNASSFIKGVDWPNENFRQLRPQFAFQETPATPLYRDLVFENGPNTLTATEYNLPRRMRITADGVDWGYPVASILHGKRHLAYLHNPVTFILDQPRPTQLDVEIGTVSGEGGARIKIAVDGEQKVARDFPDPDGLRLLAERKEYRGQVLSVPIPGGRHEITVTNIGTSWARVSYRFRDLLVRKDPGLMGFALVGDNTALIWTRPIDRTYRRIIDRKRNVPTTPPALLGFTGLQSGKWTAELWDTWDGKVVKKVAVNVGVDGTAQIPVPAINRDLAIKMLRTR